MVVLEASGDSELKYAPGDHIGIYAVNRDDIVNGIVERLAPGSADPDAVFRVQYRDIVQNPITGMRTPVFLFFLPLLRSLPIVPTSATSYD